MRLLLTFLLVFCSLYAAAKRAHHSDRPTLKTEHLKGQVKSMKECVYTLKYMGTGITRIDTVERRFMQYDQSGAATYTEQVRLIKLDRTDTMYIAHNEKVWKQKLIDEKRDTILVSKFSSEYDGKGRLVSSANTLFDDRKTLYTYDLNADVHTAKDGNGKTLYENVNTYNDKNLIIETKHYNGEPDRPYPDYVVKFDVAGNDTSYISYNKGLAERTERRRYDVRNNIIEEVHFFSNGGNYSRHTWKYDNKDLVVEEGVYDKDTLETRTTYKRDAKGLLMEVRYYSGSVCDGKKMYRYDKKNNSIENDNYADTTLTRKLVYKYNEHGDLTEYDDQQPGKKIDTTVNEYTYDSQGNFIKRITYDNDKLSYVTERQITYY